jgi:N-carbamoylputrescine amidase
MRGHAIANGVYVAAVNRVGHERFAQQGIEFWGQSFVSAPTGRVLKVASVDREEVIVIECDRRKAEDTRRHWPFFRDRRIDFYAGLTKRVAD